MVTARENMGAASLSEVKLHLDIEGHASHYTIPWTELMAKVPGLSPEALWREANVTEDLASMLNRYKLIYKTSGTLGIALAEPVDIPAVSEGSMQVDASKVHPGVISGLNSPACMLSAPLEKQLFYYIGTMLPNTRPHSYVFYQLRCHLSYVALSINGDKFQYTGAMTSKFLMGTYKRVTEKGDEHVLSLIFGKTKDLPDLRGPFSYPSLTSAQSGDYCEACPSMSRCSLTSLRLAAPTSHSNTRQKTQSNCILVPISPLKIRDHLAQTSPIEKLRSYCRILQCLHVNLRPASR